MSAPTAEEQFLLELINDARLDPMGNAARYISSYGPLTSGDAAIQNALNYFNVSGSALLSAYQGLTAVAPVAWNSNLGDAATNHSAAMITAQQQSHQTPGEASLGARLTSAGYTGYSTGGENVYAYSDNMMFAHAGFMVDWGNGPDGMQSPAGHRVNIMSATFSEVGIDVTAESSTANPLGPYVVTQDFGDRGLQFVLGVAYTDFDNDDFYSVGEGRGDLRVSWGSASATTSSSGGYSLAIDTGPRTITLSGGGLSSAVTVNTRIASDNIKLDVVDGNTLLTSVSAEVSGPISIIRGIGTLGNGLTLTGGAGAQKIYGNSRNDTLNGGLGDDELSGGLGNDVLNGDDGRDVAVFDGSRSQYSVSALSGTTITVSGGTSGTDTLSSIEVFRFADGDYFWNATSGSLSRTQTQTANTAPVTDDKVVISTRPNTSVQVVISATDADGDTLSYTAQNPLSGTLSGGANGIFTYTPNSNFVGTDSFNVTVSDGKGGSVMATADVIVTQANQNPTVPSLFAAATTVNVAAKIDVRGRDPELDVLTYTASTPTYGTVTGDGTIAAGLVRVFYYTPNPGFAGRDTFDIVVSDGKGGTAVQKVEILVIATDNDGRNDAPAVMLTQAISATKNTAQTFTVLAVDPEGDAMTWSSAVPKNGTVTGGANGAFTYTPKANFTGTDSFVVSVSDGKGGIGRQTVNVTVIGPNTAPTTTLAQSLTTSQDNPISLTVSATDQDGDVLTYASTDPAHGTVDGGTDGAFTYIPDLGYNGTDRFVVTVADGRGGTATQTVTVNVTVPSTGTPSTPPVAGAPFRLVTSDGFVGEVGGAGSVLGTNGFQDITLLSHPGTITFDGSFNRGGDVLRFSGNASEYTVGITGSNARLIHGDSTYIIPFGTVGLKLVFDDGVRTLKFDASLSRLTLGSQLVLTSAAVITAPTDNGALPTGEIEGARARSYLTEGGSVSVGGDTEIIGTSGVERVYYHSGDVRLDASFNRGGDKVFLDGLLSDFDGYISGSSLIIVGNDGTLTIPFGTTGIALDFAGELRTLKFDSATSKVLLGDLQITATNAATAQDLGAGGSGGGSGNTISLDQGTLAIPASVQLNSGVNYTLTETASRDSNVVIRGFDRGDVIRITGAASGDLNFSNSDLDGDRVADDLEITFSNGTNVNTFHMLNVISGTPFIFNEATAEAAFGSNFITFG